MREKTQIQQENKNQISILNKPTFEQQTLQLKQHCSSYSPSLQLNSEHPKFSKPKEYKPIKLTLNIGHNKKIGGTKTTTPNTSKPTSPNSHFFNLSAADAVHLSGEGKRDRPCISRLVWTTKITLKPRTRPPQFLNHSPFG